MLRKYALACLFTFQFFTLFAQFPDFSDSLSLSWERMAGPPAWIHQYAETSGRMFAAAEETLFISTNNGESWEMVESFGRKRIRQLFAKDSVVIVIAEEPKLLDPNFPFTIIDLHQIWRSGDFGTSWKLVKSLIQEPETPYYNQPFEIQAPNDHLLVFNYSYYTTLNFFPSTVIIGSTDGGVTWQNGATHVNYLYAETDTFAYVKGNTPTGYISQAAVGQLNEQPVSLSGASANYTNILKVGFHQGVFHLLKNDNTWWSTVDFGQNWTSVSLPIGGTLMSADVQFKNGRFYLVTESGIFTGLFSAPSNLQHIYHGEAGKTAKANAFFPASNSYWLNTDLFQTVHSEDNGQSWTSKSLGLSAEVGSFRSVCSTIWVQTLGAGNKEGGWYFSNTPSLSFTQTTDPFFYQFAHASNFLGDFNGYSFRYLPPFVQRSEDCGETWLNNPVLVTAKPSGLISHQNKLILYSNLDVKFWHSQNNGESWTIGELPEYSVIEVVSIQNRLVAFYGDQIFVSQDIGVSWTQQSLPFAANRILIKEDKLILQNNPQNSGPVQFAESTDFGANWTITSSFTVDEWQKSVIPYVTTDWHFLHYKHQLFVSGDAGQHWTGLFNLPFNSRIPLYGSMAVDTFIPQASRYYMLDGYLYAATEAHGLWRCSADSIAAHLQGTSPTFTPKQLPERWSIAPNPSSGAISVFWESAFAESIDLYLSSLEGRQTWLGQWQLQAGANMLLPDLSRFPAGVYFLSIQTPRGRSAQKVWLLK
ncbi:MAG TPA: hypothetical protein VK168_21740 [Saprospiraceae bacterium]|nr:hypothetical protein [Saprospiraceae bacterium]